MIELNLQSTAIVVLLLFAIVWIVEWAIIDKVNKLREDIDMAFEELKQAIDRSLSVQAAAIVLIKDLADKIANMAQHPNAEEMRKLAAELHQKADDLANAIADKEEDGEDEKEAPETRRR